MSADNRRGGHQPTRHSARTKSQADSVVTPPVTPIQQGGSDSTVNMATDINAKLLKSMQEMTASNKEMVTKFAVLETSMTTNANVMNRHIDKAETHMTTVTDDIGDLTERLERAEAAIVTAASERKQVFVENLRLRRRVDRDSTRLRQVDEGRKRKNIVIEGL